MYPVDDFKTNIGCHFISTFINQVQE